MASATIETFCCISSVVEPSILHHLQFNAVPYNVVCSISAVFGIIGALYQILPYPARTTTIYRDTGHRQRMIINWLALADFFASLGIFLRSVFWLIEGDVSQSFNPQTNENMITCAVFSMWIRYFFTATYLWTLCYAVDVYFVSQQKTGNLRVYHLFTWSTSAVLTVTGLGTLYLPSFQCHSGPWGVLPNYLLSFIPILVVMVVNPVLYFLASKHLRILLSGCLGQLTSTEHALLEALKEKFFSIVLVFYVCWLPNVINGLILWGLWSNIPQSTLICVWYIMAFLNPLQAVLNSLVYKGWGNCPSFWYSVCCRPRQARSSSFLLEESSSEYRLTSADDRTSYSTNRYQ